MKEGGELWRFCVNGDQTIFYFFPYRPERPNKKPSLEERLSEKSKIVSRVPHESLYFRRNKRIVRPGRT